MDKTPDQEADDDRGRWGASLFARQLGVLGERTRTVRKSREWSQQDLANRTGMGRPSVSGIEGGKQNITLEVLWRLASGLQVHWADLLDDRKADLPPPHTESSPFIAQLRAFGTNVFQTRVLQRLSQQALTARTGINRWTISMIELGTQNIKLETLSRLASGLHVHWADLLDDRQPAGPPRPPNGGAVTTDDLVVAELQAICEVCQQPIDDGQGAVWVRPPAQPPRTPSEACLFITAS